MAKRVISVAIQESNDSLIERFALESIEFMPEKQLCKLLDVSKFKIAGWVKEYGLDRYKSGDKVFYKTSEINKLIDTFRVPVEKYEHIKIGR